MYQAKSLDPEEIREKMKEEDIKKAESVEKIKPKRSKKVKKEKVEEKEEKEEAGVPDEEELRDIFEEETGKNAVWRGRVTKQYKEWKEEEYGIS
jgi:hypothetical protein